MTDRHLNVLFLCQRNSTLSIFGEAILKRMGMGKFNAFSAGSAPSNTIDDLTMYQLERNNYAQQGLEVNDWNDYAGADAPEMDFIIVLSEETGDVDAMSWNGDPMFSRWHIADPANSTGDEMARKAAFVKALTELESRISILVNLPIDSLDRLKLQQQLNEIGGSN